MAESPRRGKEKVCRQGRPLRPALKYIALPLRQDRERSRLFFTINTC